MPSDPYSPPPPRRSARRSARQAPPGPLYPTGGQPYASDPQLFAPDPPGYPRVEHSPAAQRPAGPPFPADPTSATRHLCAGAYLDEVFRQQVLREVYHRPSRLVAPSYGYDLMPVLGHCLVARRLAILRDAAVCGLLLIAVLASRDAVVMAAVLLLLLQIGSAAVRLLGDVGRALRARAEGGWLRLLVRGFLVMVGAGLASWLVLLIAVAAKAPSVLAGVQSRAGYGAPAPVAGPAPVDVAGPAAGLGAGAVLAVLLVGISMGFAAVRQTRLESLRSGRPLTVPVRTRRLDAIAAQHGNTVVYSGFRPYVGSGEVLDTWSFALRLVRPAPDAGDVRQLGHLLAGAPGEHQREFAQPPFAARDLVGHLRRHLGLLVPEGQAEEHVPGLTVEDRVFLSGSEVARPDLTTPPDVVEALVRHPTTPARHHLSCQVVSWGGELVTTVHVHVAVQGRSLYLELTTTALGPCRDEYRILNSVDGTGPVAWVRGLTGALFGAPLVTARAPLNLARSLADVLISHGERQFDEVTATARGVDRGARVAVRELGTDGDMRNMTQLADVRKVHQLVERRVLAATLDFLDDRGIDTTEYRMRAASVLNVGVANIGGQTTVHGSVTGQAVGVGA
jgi:hypothetical protein